MSLRCGLRLQNSWMNGFETGNLVESEEEKKERDAGKQEKLAQGEANSIPLLNLKQLKDHLNKLDQVHEHLGFRFHLRGNQTNGAQELILVKSQSKGTKPKELDQTEVSKMFKSDEKEEYEVAESLGGKVKRLEKEVAEEKRLHEETLSTLEMVMDINKKIETANADLRNTVARGDATVNKLYERIEELTGKWNDINKEFGKLTEKCAGLGLVNRSESQV